MTQLIINGLQSRAVIHEELNYEVSGKFLVDVLGRSKRILGADEINMYLDRDLTNDDVKLAYITEGENDEQQD